MASNESLNKNMARFSLGTATELGDGRVELRFSRDYDANLETLWRMLTEPEKTPLWWCKVRGQARTGSSFDLKWLNVKDEGHGIETDWWNGRVIEATAPTAFEVSNSMHGTIRVELVSLAENKTRLVFTNTIQVPEEVVHMSLAGWHVHLDHLQEALEGKAVDWEHWWADFYPCWEEIHAAYTAD